MKKLTPFTEIKAYRDWTIEKDKALEVLLFNARSKSSDILRAILGEALLLSKASYERIKNPNTSYVELENLESKLKGVFLSGSTRLLSVYVDTIIYSYLLSKTGELEIISRVTRLDKVNKVNGADLVRVIGNRYISLEHKSRLFMDRLRRKLLTQIQANAYNSPDVETFLTSLLSCLPKQRLVKRPNRVLKPQLMKEADDTWQDIYKRARSQGATAAEATMLLDELAKIRWREMLDEYKKDYIPKWRSPEYVIDLPISDPTIQATTGEGVWYAWEFERDLTQEFVNSVRAGELDAAKENGITDFIWIAVVDSHTDDCCLWRDGLLISEIEERLAEHEDEDDECGLENGGLVPPIHFNCRCRIAPASENIPDIPDDGAKEFEEWLNT